MADDTDLDELGPTAREEKSNNELKGTGYEIFIAALSVLSILNLFLIWFVVDASLDQVIRAMNVLLTLIFIMDFLFRFFTARSKVHYFFRGFGWADLLASLPFTQVKVFRLFRLVKVFRLLKENGPRNVGRALIRDRAGNALLSLLLIAVLMLEFGSLEMLRLEQYAPSANITNASDAMWYIIVTMSTVGYGDQFPITNPGRLLGTVIIIIGVGIFGTLTGYLANLFLSPAKKPEPEDETADAASVQARIQQMKHMLAQQQAALDELEASIKPD